MRLRMAAAVVGLVCLVLITLFWPAGGQQPQTVESNGAAEPPDELVLAPPPDELPAPGVGPGRRQIVEPASAVETGSSIHPRVIAEAGSTVKPRGLRAVPLLPPAHAIEAGSVVKAGVPVARPRIAVVPEAGSVVPKGGRAVPATVPAVVRPGLRIAVAAPPALDRGLLSLNRMLKFSPDGQHLAVGRGDGRIQIVDVATAKPLRLIETPSKVMYDMAYAPDGTLIVSGGDKLLTLYDSATGHAVRTFDPKMPSVLRIALTPNGETLVGGCNDGRLFLLSLSTGEVRPLGQVPAGPWQVVQPLPGLPAIAISPNGRFAAASGNHSSIFFWSLESPGEPRVLSGGGGLIRRLAFSPDGHTLASVGSQPRVTLWDDLSNRDQAMTKTIAMRTSVEELQFDRHGAHLFVGWIGPSVSRLSVKGGDLQPLIEISPHKAMRGLALSPDGQTLAIISTQGQVSLCRLDPETSAVLQRIDLPVDTASPREGKEEREERQRRERKEMGERARELPAAPAGNVINQPVFVPQSVF